MRGWKVLVVSLVLFYQNIEAQRFFTVKVDTLTRSYLLVSLHEDERTRVPIIVIIHDPSMLSSRLASMHWNSIQKSAILVFPVGLNNQWHSSDEADSLLAASDQKFILKMIFDVQQNFKTDASQVFLLGMGDSFKVAQEFTARHPSIVRSVVKWEYSKEKFKTLADEADDELDSLLKVNPSSLPVGVPGVEQFPFEQEIEPYKPYRNNFSFSLNLGRWQQAESSRAEFDTLTFVDVAQYHFMFGVEVEYNITEALSAFLQVNAIVIPKERRINSISFGGGRGIQVNATGKGGVIVPYGLGIRYAFLHKNFRPFILGSVGKTFLYIGGGKASGGPGRIKKDITKRKENVWKCTIGSGFDARLSSTLSFRLSANYTFSSSIDPPLGSINHFQGLSFMAGLAFILGK